MMRKTGMLWVALLFFCLTGRGQAQTMPWAASFAAAKQQAAGQNRLIMVDFYTTWCGPCKWLEQNTYRDKEVLRLCQQIVPVKVEADKCAGLLLAKHYNVRAYPTILFLRPDGQIVERMVGAKPPQRFIPAVQKILLHWAQVRNAPRPPQGRTMPSESETVFKENVPPPPAPPVRADVAIENFESVTFDRWEKTGDCWGQGTEGAAFAHGLLTGWQGNFYVTTAHAHRAGDIPDSGKGQAVSPTFLLTGEAINLRIAGGRHPDACCVQLLVDGQVVQSATGEGDLTFRRIAWDIRQWAGKRGQIKIIDDLRFGPKGYLFVDDIVQCAALLPPTASPSNQMLARSERSPEVGEPEASIALPVSRDVSRYVPPPSDTPGTDAQRRALAMVNRLRQAAGLSPYRWDRRIAAAAQAHSDYQVRNHLWGHYEKSTVPGFTGANPSARVAAAGYPNGVWEDVHYGASSPEASILALFLVPYHRKPILHTSGRDIGIGISGKQGQMTIDFAAGWDAGTVIWPYNGQVGVPTRGSVAETPYPLRIYNFSLKNAPKVGYVVSYFHFGNSLRVASAELRSADGRLVDCWINSPANDDSMRDGVLLIPKRPLALATSYVVNVSASDDRGRDLSRRWTFRTTANKAR